jgi:hypothetical protein
MRIQEIDKPKGDTNKFSDITFSNEGSLVRIRTKRFSTLKRYSSPISLLVEPDNTGRWHIHEEISESRH